jgi:hypothetical protein
VAEWKKLDAGLVNVDNYQATVDIASGVLDPLTTALKTTSSLLKLVAAAVFGLPPALEQVVSSAVNTIDSMVSDLLSNNAAFAVHTNLRWNPDWKWRKSEDDPERVIDYVNDDALPVTGTGTTGWLLDIAYSAYDASNPFRPLTDADTAVQGIILLKGIPGDGDLQDLKGIFDVFTDFKGYKSWFGIRDALESATEEAKAMYRLGAVGFEDVIAATSRPAGEILGDAARGTRIAAGDEGVNEPGSVVFIDNTGGGGFADVRPGDVVKLQGEDPYYSVVFWVDANTIELNHAITRSHDLVSISWQIYRGGVVSLLEALPLELREYIPKAGNFPIWVSVPIAGLIPAVGEVLSSMQDVGNSMRVGISQAGALDNLILLLERKVSLIEQAIEKLNELLVTLSAVLEFFDESYLVVVNAEDGGMARFINEAIAGSDIPYFGDRGVVVGMVAVATSDDPSAHLEKFFELAGVKFSDYASGVTVADQARRETWDRYFP